MLNWWPKVRSLLIALAFLFGGSSGIPEPNRRYLDSAPSIVRESAELFQAARAAILHPVRVIPDFFQFSQEWRLFSSAADARFLMWIEARAGRNDEWQLLYRPHDSAHTWMSDALEYRRMRGNWNPSRRGPNRGYDAFVTWVANRAFAENTEFRTVRVRMEEISFLPFGQGFAPTGRFFHERKRERDQVSP